jgi:hypothetical protein
VTRPSITDLLGTGRGTEPRPTCSGRVRDPTVDHRPAGHGKRHEAYGEDS